MDLEIVVEAVGAQAVGSGRPRPAVALEDVVPAVRLPGDAWEQSGGDQGPHRCRGHSLDLAIALGRVLDGPEIALHVQRVDTVSPGPARLVLVRLGEHRFGERSGELQLSTLRRQPGRE